MLIASGIAPEGTWSKDPKFGTDGSDVGSDRTAGSDGGTDRTANIAGWTNRSDDVAARESDTGSDGGTDDSSDDRSDGWILQEQLAGIRDHLDGYLTWPDAPPQNPTRNPHCPAYRWCERQIH